MSFYSSYMMSEKLEERLLSRLLYDSPEARASKVCDCDFDSVGRVDLFNDVQLPSPYYHEMRTYFYDAIYNAVGQHELMYTQDKSCHLSMERYAINNFKGVEKKMPFVIIRSDEVY